MAKGNGEVYWKNGDRRLKMEDTGKRWVVKYYGGG